MTENKRSIAPDWSDPDEAPDLSVSPWHEKLAATPIKRGRPKLSATKVSTTIRLDADIVAAFRNEGPQWQTRINEVLRASLKN
jgi:uncharacterized protein (DUF4415 family)